MNRPDNNKNLRAIAEAIEAAFGPESVGLGAGPGDNFSEAARALFVREAILSSASDRAQAVGGDAAHARLEARSEARRELSAALGVDENEVFRLHHRAAGLLARDRSFKKVACEVRKRLMQRFDSEACFSSE